ncbi:MAG: GIY-YIG nuclease family protein [Gemmatimonadetes bacterium]|nr:GIY-YIG nuclease family protein [Gemmatimonadota bacterium]
MISEALARKLDTLADGPGVYLWRDAEGEVLYVGKAKKLRTRVRSYFATDFPDSPKHRLLQRRIADVETIVVVNEAQSLLLENNLIKEYQPRFNVRMKDDKSYPSIAVTLGEPFPRVLATRRRDIPKAKYYGPYTDVGDMRRTLGLVRRMFTVRSCSDNIPVDRRERPCLDYHIGRCKAPCVGWQGETSYRAMITEVTDFLDGRTVDLKARIRVMMHEASERGGLRASQGSSRHAQMVGAGRDAGDRGCRWHRGRGRHRLRARWGRCRRRTPPHPGWSRDRPRASLPGECRRGARWRGTRSAPGAVVRPIGREGTPAAAAVSAG